MKSHACLPYIERKNKTRVAFLKENAFVVVEKKIM